MRINLNDFNIYDHVIREFSSSEELILDYRLESVFRLINFPDAVANCFSCLEHVHTRILTSDYDPEYVKKSIRDFPQVYKHIDEVEVFPFGHLERVFRRSEMIDSYKDYRACDRFKYHFIFLNRAANWPRFLMMKRMLDDDFLLSKGAVSWLNRFNKTYDIKERIVLDSPDADTTQHQFPPQYEEAFVDVICETNACDYDISPTMMTEKSWRPLLCGKVFLIYGAPGFYRYLKSLGFDVFDDLFDTRFDEVLPNDERIVLFYNSLDQFVKRYRLEDLNKLNLSLQDRFERNRQICVSLNERNDFSMIIQTHDFL